MTASLAPAEDREEIADPIAMEVFNNRLLSITEDMGNTLIRSSFSTNIKERRDCSVGLFDARGRCVAQASHMPMHLGSLWGSTQAILEQCRLEDIEDGDAFICNDVYLVHGTHQPDVTVVTPVFCEGRLSFFCANVGHHSDVGGRVPGSISGTNRTIFEEGIRIPVIRIVRAGELDEDLMNLLVHKHPRAGGPGAGLPGSRSPPTSGARPWSWSWSGAPAYSRWNGPSRISSPIPGGGCATASRR